MNRIYSVATRNFRLTTRIQKVKLSTGDPKAAPKLDKPTAPLAKNYATAFLLLGFVGAVYYTSISKMRQTVCVNQNIFLSGVTFLISLCCTRTTSPSSSTKRRTSQRRSKELNIIVLYVFFVITLLKIVNNFTEDFKVS